MTWFEDRSALTHAGTMTMLAAAVAEAEAIGQPQCIVVVDASGEPLGEIRMTGAKFLSRKSALAKARTAASNNGPARCPQRLTTSGAGGFFGSAPERMTSASTPSTSAPRRAAMAWRYRSTGSKKSATPMVHGFAFWPRAARPASTASCGSGPM